MSYYLDTSIVRKWSNNLKKLSAKYDLRTSCLTVFELISGISEKDYTIRRASIQSLLNSNLIQIDWDFYNIKQRRAFKLNSLNEDGLAVKDLAYKLVESKSYDEFKSIVCKREEKCYSLELLSCFDNSVVCNSKKIAASANQLHKSMSKSERKALINDVKDKLLQVIQVDKEILISEMALDLSNSNSRSDKAYLNTINNYDASLDLFFSYSLLFSLSLECFGRNYSKNDIFDLCHFLYLKEGDFIISEDSIFKDLNAYLNMVKVFSSEDLHFSDL